MTEHISINKLKKPTRSSSATNFISIPTPSPRRTVDRDSKARFTLDVSVRATGEAFTLSGCHGNMRIRELKRALEMAVGIPTDFQRIFYLDQGDLPEDSTLHDNDIVPGTAVTVAVWPYSGWTELVTAAASGDVYKLRGVMSRPAPQRSSASSWLAHRLLSALFIAAHRGHAPAVRFLLQRGADVGGQTPQGRGALHAAAAQGRVQVIQDLLLAKAPLHLQDGEGMTALSVAAACGQRKSTRQLFLFHWQERAAGVRIKPHLEERELFAHQRYDSHLRTWQNGRHAQRYMAYLGGEGRGESKGRRGEGRMSRGEGKGAAGERGLRPAVRAGGTVWK